MSLKADLRTQLLNQDNADIFRSEVEKGASLRTITRVVRKILEKQLTAEEVDNLRANFGAAIQGKQLRDMTRHGCASFFMAFFLFLFELYSCVFGGVKEEAQEVFQELDKVYGELTQVVAMAKTAPWVVTCYSKGLLTLDEINQLYSYGGFPKCPKGQQKVLKKGSRFPRNILIDGNKAYLLLNTPNDPRVGKGVTSTAWRALDLQTGRLCVVLSSTLDYDPSQDTRLATQVDLARKLKNSPHFPELYAVKIVKNRRNQEKHWRVFEYCELGNFHQIIPMSGSGAKTVALDLLYGLRDLHAQGYVHTDLHQGNAVFYIDDQENVRAKIIDLERAVPINSSHEELITAIPADDIFSLSWIFQHITHAVKILISDTHCSLSSSG